MKLEGEMPIPHLFMCPISLDLLKDPVTLCTGQTYDRSSIEKWISAGNLTCPVTMQKLHDLSMVPNHTLRHLIEEWVQIGHQIDPDYFNAIGVNCSTSSLKRTLQSRDSLETKLRALEKIHSLSQELPSRNSFLIQQDFFPLLLELIFDKTKNKYSRDDLRFAEAALVCAQRLLPFSDLGCLNILKEESKLESFTSLFEQGSEEIKIILCHLVEAISASLATKDLCQTIGRNHVILRGIIKLLDGGSEASDAGIKAVAALSNEEPNAENLAKEGGVGGLVRYILGSERSGMSAAAMGALERMVRTETGRDAAIAEGERRRAAVKAMVSMVFRVSDHAGSESAVNALVTVCGGSEGATEEAIGVGLLTQLLLLLQSQCGVRAKAKARGLLKLLRSSGLRQGQGQGQVPKHCVL